MLVGALHGGAWGRTDRWDTKSTLYHRKPKLDPAVAAEQRAARAREAKREAILKILNHAGKRPRRDHDLVGGVFTCVCVVGGGGGVRGGGWLAWI